MRDSLWLPRLRFASLTLDGRSTSYTFPLESAYFGPSEVVCGLLKIRPVRGVSSYTSTQAPDGSSKGTCMALQLYKRDEQIRLLVGYEDGRLALFADGSGVPHDQIRSKEGQGWELLWHDKGHKEPSA